jgi:hypothetical protein
LNWGLALTTSWLGKLKKCVVDANFYSNFFHQLNNIILSYTENHDSSASTGGGAHQKAILFMDDRLRILDQEVAIEKNTCSMRQM